MCACTCVYVYGPRLRTVLRCRGSCLASCGSEADAASLNREPRPLSGLSGAGPRNCASFLRRAVCAAERPIAPHQDVKRSELERDLFRAGVLERRQRVRSDEPLVGSLAGDRRMPKIALAPPSPLGWRGMAEFRRRPDWPPSGVLARDTPQSLAAVEPEHLCGSYSGVFSVNGMSVLMECTSKAPD